MHKIPFLGKDIKLVLLLLFLLSPIISNLINYSYTKNYNYVIESSCDPLKEICFLRDCNIADECPPNNLFSYKKFYIKAYNFPKCTDNSCENECNNGLVNCDQIPCGNTEEDICSNQQYE